MSILSATEEKILEAARNVFSRKGMDGARMQEIADEAGINKALLHYYFRSKEKLFEMIFREATSRILPGVKGSFASEVSFEEKVRHFVESYYNLLTRNRFLPVFVLTELSRKPDLLQRHFLSVMQREDALIKTVETAIRRAIDAGEIRPINPYDLILNMIALCVFPFIASPIFKTLTAMSDEEYEALLHARKKTVVDFVMASLRP